MRSQHGLKRCALSAAHAFERAVTRTAATRRWCSPAYQSGLLPLPTALSIVWGWMLRRHFLAAQVGVAAPRALAGPLDCRRISNGCCTAQEVHQTAHCLPPLPPPPHACGRLRLPAAAARSAFAAVA